MGLDMYLFKCHREAIKFKGYEPDGVKETNPVLYAQMEPYLQKRGIPDAFEWESIFEEVGYWRKANQIHNWFVTNVQDREDDCGSYEVTEEQLTELLDICKEVLEGSVMMQARVKNSYTFNTKGERVYGYEPGKVIINPELARSLLPTQNGFFFGGTDYDEYYLEDIANSVVILSKVIEETDFSSHAIFYSSSW